MVVERQWPVVWKRWHTRLYGGLLDNRHCAPAITRNRTRQHHAAIVRMSAKVPSLPLPLSSPSLSVPLACPRAVPCTVLQVSKNLRDDRTSAEEIEKRFFFFFFFVLPEQLNSVLKMENKSSLMTTISLNRLNLRYSSFLREYSRFLQRSLKFSYLHHADLYSIEVIFFVFFLF